LLAEAVSPVRSRVTAAEVVQLPTAITLATGSSSSSVKESQQQQVAAVLVLGDEGGSVMVFALPASCWTPAVAAAAAAGSSCSNREAWRQLHQQHQQQQQAGLGVQLQLVHRFKAAHGISHVSMVRPQPWQQHSSSSSSSSGSRGSTAAAAGSVGFSTAGRDGCIAHYSVHAVHAAAGETLEVGQQATDSLQQDLQQQQQQQQVRVVLIATERLPGVTTLEHVVHLRRRTSPETTSHAALNVSSSGSSSSRVLLGFKSSQCVAWNESSGSEMWQEERASIRRPRCFWAAADAFKLSDQGSGNSHINGSSSSGGSIGTQQQKGPLLMFAYLKDEDVHVVTYGREPAAAATAAAAGVGNSRAGAASAAASAAVAAAAVPVPVGLPASSSQLPGGHHGREVLAAVMLPGPAAAAAGCDAAGSLYALLTASEDGTVRAIVVQNRQQQEQQQQQLCAPKAPASTERSRTSDNSSSSVCGVTCDAGGASLEVHLLGAHSSGVAVRCLDAAAIPSTAAPSVTSSSASRISSASAKSQEQQQRQQPWLVVAGCAQEVLLVWQVHWQQQQQQQQQWKLGWQLLCSKAPSRGLRPAPQAAGSASSSSDARHLAVAIVAVKRLQLAAGAAPLTCNHDEDDVAPAAAGKGSQATANTGMAAMFAVSLSDGRLQLLRLSLPYASWQPVAVLQQGSRCDSFSHPILSMSVLQLPVTQQKDGSVGGDKTSSSSSRSSSGAEDAYLLAAGGSDGQAYVFDVTAAVDLLQQQQQTQEQVATGSNWRGSSRASSCVLKLHPLLVLPAVHQSVVNDLQLVAVTSHPAGSPAEAAKEADSTAASCYSDKQQQQQQQEQQQQQLLLVTGGDDQALAVTQLSAALSRSSSSGITVALSVIGGVTCSNAHTSAIRGLFATPLQHMLYNKPLAAAAADATRHTS
jgi:hypothetical protein